MKNIFTKTLTLIAFLSLSIGVWGADIPSSLSFDWSKYGNGTSLSGASSDKVVLDGDFEWSGVGENNLKHSSGYCLFKGDDAIEVAQSRQKYTFQKGTYQVEIACMVKEDKKLYTPIVVVDQNTWNKSYVTHPSTYTTSNPEKKWTETLEIVVPAAGDYYVRAQFKSTGDEKCGAGQITFTYKGGGDDPTPPGPTPTPTCSSVLTIPCANNFVPITIVNDADGEANSASYGTYEKQTSDGSLYYYVNLPNGTYTISATYNGSGDVWCNYFKKGSNWNGQVSYKGTTYGDKQYHKMNDGNWTNLNLSGEYLISIGRNGAEFTNIIITEQNGNKVFCSDYEPMTRKMYFKPNDNWHQGNEFYQIYFIEQGGDHWSNKLTQNACDPTIYETEIPKDYTGKVIYVRLDASKSPSTWNSKWDQTGDLSGVSDSKNYFDVSDWNTGLKQYTPTTYTVSYAAGDHGTGTMTDSKSPYACGSNVTVLANGFEANGDYEFDGYSYNSNNYSPGDVINGINSNITLTAQWKAIVKYTITVESSDENKGTVTGGGSYKENTQQEISATPKSGYGFYQWNDGNTDNPRTITVTGDATYTASFKAMVCTNTLTWEAEDESKMISPTGVTTCNYYKDKNSDGGTDIGQLLSNASDGHFISMKQDDGAKSKCIYYHFSTSGTANLSFIVRASSRYRDKSGTIILYSTKQSGSSVFTYEGKDYKKVDEFTQQLGGDNDLQWRDLTHTFNGQVADDYVVAVHSSEDYWTMFYDKFTITASSDVFCTEAPAEPDSWHLYIKDKTLDNDLFVNNSKTVTLAKEQTYEFKIVKWVANVESDKVWYTDQNATESSAHMTENNHSNWNFSKTDGGSSNTRIDAAAAGDYTFTINTTGSFPVVSVTYPASYTATFDMQGHGSAPAQQTHLATGDKVVAPATPSDVTGWHFVGWYKEQACTNVFDFNNETISNSDVTIYAKWEKAVTEIAIHMEDGTHKDLDIHETNQLYVTYTPDDATYGHEIASWVSSNASFVSVSSTGLATAVGSGTATITATTTNGVQAVYDIHVNQPVCDDWYVHLWNGTSTTDYCLTMYNEGTQEMRTESNVRLPSNSASEKITVLCAKGGDTHKADWQIMGVPMVGQQGNCTHDNGAQYYAGQDAVGYFRIFKNSTFENYYIAFQPTYVAMYGLDVDGGTYTQIEFHNTSGNEYETDIFQVPDGYKTNENYKYYVGTKRAENSDQSPFIYDGKSRNDQLKDVSGLSGDDWGGKYGKFHIFDNSCDANFYCSFIAYKVVDLYNAEELYYRQSCLNSASDKVTFSIPEAPTGYEFTSWTRQDNTYSVKPTDDDWTNYGMWTPYERFNAVWTPITYNITYTDAGTHTNPATYTIEDTPIELQDPQKDGYTFVKWTIGDDDITTIAAGTTGDLTLTAHWTPTVYHINYTNLGGAENTNPTSYTIESETITFVAPGTRTGYTFGAWDPASIAHGSTGDKTITASWNLVNYSITYHDATTTNPTSYTIESSFDLTAPSARTGYEFLGWYTDAQYTNQITAITPGMHENKDIYAKWENAYCSNTFTIDCHDSYLTSSQVTGGASSPSELEALATTGDYTGWHGNGFVKFGNSTGTIYFYVHIPETTTYDIAVWNANGGTKNLKIYRKDNNGSLTYKQNKYSDTNKGFQVSYNNWSSIFVENKQAGISLEADDYIFALDAGSSWGAYDQIVITANSKVFCPEMYTVEFAADPSDKGTVTARIKNGATISSGDEVPENTVVVFAASDIAEGYELVNWTDGESHELAGAVNSFEQKITSNITVNANIEIEATKYTVTATAGEHGTITSGAGEYREGATVTIVTAPAANYKVGSATSEQVDDFTIDGNNVSFTMPAEPVAVTVNFAFDEVHNIIATGTSTNVGSQRGYGGDGSITVSSITDPTGHFTHNVLDYNYTMPYSSSYCGYSLPADDGYTTNSKATGLAFWYIADDNVYMEIKVNGDNVFKLSSTNGEWHYVYLETSAVKTGTSFEIWMNYSKGGWSMTKSTGHVYFSEIQATNVTEMSPIVPPVDLTVVVSPNEGGTVVTSPATTTGLTKGTEVTLTATPADNYRFVNWTVGGTEVSTDATYNRIVNATETITANFERVYSLVVNHDEHIASVTGAGQYAAGESVTVTATAAQGYKFTKWTAGQGGGELATTSSYTFDMPATDNYTVYANSEQDITYYQITLGPCTNGTIAATVNNEPYTGTDLTANTPVVLTATPAEGYGFVQWKDGSRENPHTIYANAETETFNPWTATFDQQFTVTATYGQPGTSVTGGGEYPTGAEVTLTANWTLASKDFTYGFKEWIDVTGVNLSDEQKVSNPLTFSMPFANVSMKATFAPVECVDTYIIQCEDGNASLIENDPKLTLKPFERCNGGGCKVYKDHYTGYHGEGYWDFKEAGNMAMYYPVTLEPGTYSFTVWNTTDNQARGCWMYIYTPSETDVVLTYDGQNFKEAAKQNVDFYNTSPAYFGEGGTISNIVIPSHQKVFIALYASDQWSAWDQIVITATENVFCEEISTETFTILSDEAKEIPVSGVKNLVVYEGGQATNEDDVEVFETVKYIRSITEANIDQWSTFAVPYTATKTQVSKDGVVDDIYPVYLSKTNGSEQMGYYFMEVLTDKNAEAIGQESRARWDRSYTQQPQKDSAYITMFPHTQSDGYFIGSEIFYIGDYRSSGGVTLTGSKNAFIENGGWPEEGKPKYYYFPNSAITAIQPYDAYVLSEDGTEFVITDHPTIKPFQCYIQATTEFKELYPRLVIRQNSGGTTDLIPVTADGWNVSGVDKIMIDEVIYIVRDGKIYTVMGQLVK